MHESLGTVRVEREIGGRTLILQTGSIAKLCDAAVLAMEADVAALSLEQDDDEH